MIPIVTLGDIDDPAGVGSSAQIARSGAGVYAVSSHTSPGEIIVYDSSGEFQQLVGRQGEGPGEFSSEVQVAFDAADSLHVVSLGGSRYSVFTPAFEHARSVALPGTVTDFCIDRDGRLFAVGPTLVGSTVWPARVYGRSGEELASMGGIDMDVANPGESHWTAACGDDAYWSGARAAYLLTRWEREGHEQHDVRASRDWFPPPRVARPGSGPVAAMPRGEGAPFPRISGLSLDGRGHLIVFVSVPDPDWEAAGADPRGRRDTILEVMDVSTGELLLRQRFDDALAPIDGGGAFSIFEGDLGNLRVQVWDLAFSVP